MTVTPAQRFIQLLRSEGAIDDRLVTTVRIPPRKEETRDWPTWTSSALRAAWKSAGITYPWSHQVEAAQALYSGHHTIVTTGTGSGKSLAAWLAYLSRAGEIAKEHAATNSSSLRNRIPTALYIAPTKALAHDQERHLRDIVTQAGFPLDVVSVDGDSSHDDRVCARTSAHIVVTNPDFLHYSLLPSQSYWRHLLRSLDLIVLDEAHTYRGIFGAHVALIMRRLLRLTSLLGAKPTMALLSATIADPQETAARFIGCDPDDVTAITHDGSGAGEHTVMVWQPRLLSHGDTDEGKDTGEDADDTNDAGSRKALGLSASGGANRRSVTREGAELTARLVGAGAHVLTFVRSRGAAESVAAMTRDEISRYFPEYAGRFAAYRGGYLPEERRILERQLRTGDLRGLATTSALEMGIDISGLDVTITCGWPGTRASWWQQSGRAGRAGESGLSVLIVGDNPLDAYLGKNPDHLFDSVESTVFNTQNPYILGPHLCCAAAEAPLNAKDYSLFQINDDILSALSQQGLLRRRPRGWYWNMSYPQNPWSMVSMRSGEGTIQIIRLSRGDVVGTVDSARADTTCHIGAIYVHQGHVFRVKHREDDVALVEPAPSSLRTRAWEDTRIRIVHEDAHAAGPHGYMWHTGDVEVIQHTVSYDELRLPGLQFLGEHPLDLPPRSFVTSAVWWTAPDGPNEAWPLSDSSILPGALHAAEHASIGILPLVATCDRWDLGGLSTAFHEQTALPTVFVYDAHAGGAGFARYGFAHREEWMQETYRAVVECGCADGCPLCIQSPKCGNNNEPLHKRGAIKILQLLATGSSR